MKLKYFLLATTPVWFGPMTAIAEEPQNWVTPVMTAVADTLSEKTKTEEGIQALATAMTTDADNFSKQIDELATHLEEAINSEERAQQLFNAMEQAVRAYLDKLGNKANFKQLLDNYIQRLDDAKERNLQKFHDKQDSFYKEMADKYDGLLKEAEEVSQQILAERKESIFLLDKIRDQQDKVIEMLRYGMFERANASLKTALTNLQQMRKSLNGLSNQILTIGKKVPHIDH